MWWEGKKPLKKWKLRRQKGEIKSSAKKRYIYLRRKTFFLPTSDIKEREKIKGYARSMIRALHFGLHSFPRASSFTLLFHQRHRVPVFLWAAMISCTYHAYLCRGKTRSYLASISPWGGRGWVSRQNSKSNKSEDQVPLHWTTRVNWRKERKKKVYQMR